MSLQIKKKQVLGFQYINIYIYIFNMHQQQQMDMIIIIKCSIMKKKIYQTSKQEKAKFSKMNVPFATWVWVYNTVVYQY